MGHVCAVYLRAWEEAVCVMIVCEETHPRSVRRVLSEDADVHYGEAMQGYIQRETEHPSKQWVYDVLSGAKEHSRVIVETEDFIILPDLNPGTGGEGYTHWLGLAKERRLRTIRDLRGTRDAEMLARMHDAVVREMQGRARRDVRALAAYANYPPSVYHLHFHFKFGSANFPLTHAGGTGTYCDTCRIHPLHTVVNNLRVCENYYQVSVLQVPVYAGTELYGILDERGRGFKSGEEAAADEVYSWPVRVRRTGLRSKCRVSRRCSVSSEAAEAVIE